MSPSAKEKICIYSTLNGKKHETEFSSHISDIIRIVDESPTGRTILYDAARRGVTVGMDAFLEASSSFYYTRHDHLELGYLSAAQFLTQKGRAQHLVSFITALSRLQAPEIFSVSHHRRNEAEAEATLHQVSWELRAMGFCFLWRHLASEPDRDIAEIFENYVRDNPHSQFNGEARAAALAGWFLRQDRIEAADERYAEPLENIMKF